MVDVATAGDWVRENSELLAEHAGKFVLIHPQEGLIGSADEPGVLLDSQKDNPLLADSVLHLVANDY